MSFGVSLEGLSQVKAKLDKLPEDVDKKVADLINKTAINIQNNAKRLAPVDTGRLRSSIRIRFYRDNGPAADIYTDVEYAAYLEFGTKRMSARPYMTPAWELERAKFEEALRSILG